MSKEEDYKSESLITKTDIKAFFENTTPTF